MSKQTPSQLYIGLMSGTSLDGVDAALISFTNNQATLLDTYFLPFTDQVKTDALSLTAPGDNEIDRMGELDNTLGEIYAQAVNKLLQKSNISPKQITAIGSHGQTIRHRPSANQPFTLQIGNPTIIAERTGITTVADFRRRDMAAGGQGAPLVPAFHQDLFSGQRNRIILNVGGIANVTYLPIDTSINVTGFDTGPGNMLMDAWIHKHCDKPFDQNGDWAASGKVRPSLLANLLADDYYTNAPPKSTGREKYNLEWLEMKLEENDYQQTSAEDVQATLCELTAVTITQAIEKWCKHSEEILICGGGAHNQHLIQRLQTLLGPRKVGLTNELGIDADWVEATAFAWLAKQAVEGLPGNLPAVTGASHPVILGAIYPP